MVRQTADENGVELRNNNNNERGSEHPKPGATLSSVVSFYPDARSYRLFSSLFLEDKKQNLLVAV